MGFGGETEAERKYIESKEFNFFEKELRSAIGSTIHSDKIS
tara:strand:- start:39 stop:161 length:123 start_codon:yes stop_codon:yes gene_type:complete